MSQPDLVQAGVHARASGPKGVGGWLLVLCILLAILNPLFILYSVVVGWQTASPLFEKVPGLSGIILLDSMLNIVIACLAMYAGIKLWLARPGADKTAKGILIAMPILRAITLLVVWASDVRGLGFRAFMGMFQAAMFAMIWHAYLDWSKRVSATFAPVSRQVPDPAVDLTEEFGNQTEAQ